MITVACVFWVGRWNRPRNYTAEWVLRLRSMVARKLDIPHRFVCLTNTEVEGVECIPLERDLPGWWSKIELFGHDLGRVLYYDLDTILTESQNEIAGYPADIAFSPPHHEIVGCQPPKAKPGIISRYQTSCFVFSHGHGYEILAKFDRSVMNRLQGDQDWIAEVNPFYEKMPREWFGKLRHCPDGPSKGMKVVFGGKSKNDDPRFKWVKDYWYADGNLQRSEGTLAHAGD